MPGAALSYFHRSCLPDRAFSSETLMFHRLLSPTLQPFMTTMMLLLLLRLCLRLVESFLLRKTFVFAQAVLQTQHFCWKPEKTRSLIHN